MTISVLHIITTLGAGGAEAMLCKLALATDPRKFRVSIISLSGEGKYGEALRQRGIDVYAVNLTKSPVSAFRLVRLFFLIRKISPDIIQGWMAHGNLVAALVKLLGIHKKKIVWNVRQTLMDNGKHERLLTTFLIRLNRYFSKYPETIIYNSIAGAEQHEALGYDPASRKIIPNGFDTDIYRPSPTIRTSFFAAHNLPENTFLIGLIARFHPMKNHIGFIHAARKLADRLPHVYFAMAGADITHDNSALQTLIAEAGLENRVLLLGEQKNPLQVIAALDLLVLCSTYGEGFPNVVGEAMACGVPCVVTPIGHSALIVADTGLVVAPNDADGLADAIAQIVALDPDERARLGAMARQRVIDHYSLQHIVSQYEELYFSVAAG